MSGPKLNVRVALFSFAMNECSFPECDALLVHDDSVVGQACHIHAQSPGGPCHSEELTDEELHGLENLIALCSTHHKIVDDHPAEYNVELLRQYKREHEARTTTSSSQVLRQLVNALAPAVPDEWWERPGAPEFHFDLASSRPEGRGWSFQVGLKQIAGSDIGKLRIRFVHGRDVDAWQVAELRDAQVWRAVARQLEPRGDTFSVELKFWWGDAERVVIRRWAKENDFQSAEWQDEFS